VLDSNKTSRHQHFLPLGEFFVQAKRRKLFSEGKMIR
jgi:hypothetical protein